MQDRTEPATPKKRRKAREQGQVAKSSELVTCTALLAALFAFRQLGPGLWNRLSGYMTNTVLASGHAASPDRVQSLLRDGLSQAGLVALPVMGVVAVAGFACNVAQIGIHFSPKALTPKLEKIDPLKGLKRLFSPKSIVELVKGAAKFAIVSTSGWSFVSGHMEELQRLSEVKPGEVGSRVGELVFGMTIRMVSTLTVLAALDYWYQRFQFERTLRMTKQEVKDEMRESEGNPQIKSRIKQRQRELSRRRMMAEVEKAAVVITNPTHFAMALKYEMGQKGAPTVLAKGQDLIALRIREIAKEKGVPVVENPPLARSLYQMVDIGEEIPTAMYRAVAEVLSVIWRLNSAAEARA